MDPQFINIVDKEVAKVVPEAIKFRHQCHSYPELTWQEHRTAKEVARALSQIKGIKVTEKIGKLGVVGLLKGAKPGPTIALRADMDALPIEEQTQLPYRSKNKGVHHACGHDGHIACLLGAAKVLSIFRESICGSIKFIFQPAEEGGSGAKAMIDDGVLESPKVDQIFALHAWPQLACGKIGCRPGPLMAATTDFRILIKGKGGHAAQPHSCIDPIIASSHLITQLQTIVSRSVDPTDPLVISVTKINAGNAFNVIPEFVEIGGCFRAVKQSTMELCEQKIQELATSTAQAYGASAFCEFLNSDPVTYNNLEAFEKVAKVAGHILPKNSFIKLDQPSLGGEDFSHFLKKVPGAFFFLGLNSNPSKPYPDLHNPKFDFNDKALEHGIKMLVHLGLQSI